MLSLFRKKRSISKLYLIPLRRSLNKSLKALSCGNQQIHQTRIFLLKIN